MKLRIYPSRAYGEVLAPPSKSMAHRALLCAALAKGESRLFPIAESRDMAATMSVLTALGATFSRKGEEVTVRGADPLSFTGKIPNCEESGSTLRFLVPLCLTLDQKITLLCAPRLLERPLGYYEELCREKGFLFEKTERTLTLRGRLLPGDYTVPGNVSSQFITGMLYALSTLSGESTLRVTGNLESASYLDLTLSAMSAFGMGITREENVFRISGGAYFPRRYEVEGDYSNAAFPEAFSLLGGEVRVLGLHKNSLQGDRVYGDFYPVLARERGEFDLRDCPDLAPVLFALAGLCHGGVFYGVERLRMKESDRGAAMAEELCKCGIRVDVSPHRIEVFAGGLHAPEEPISSHNDHRIAMAMSLVLSRVGGELHGAEAVAKSYPDYFDVIRSLGIEWNEI